MVSRSLTLVIYFTVIIGTISVVVLLSSGIPPDWLIKHPTKINHYLTHSDCRTYRWSKQVEVGCDEIIQFLADGRRWESSSWLERINYILNTYEWKAAIKMLTLCWSFVCTIAAQLWLSCAVALWYSYSKVKTLEQKAKTLEQTVRIQSVTRKVLQKLLSADVDDLESFVQLRCNSDQDVVKKVVAQVSDIIKQLPDESLEHLLGLLDVAPTCRIESIRLEMLTTLQRRVPLLEVMNQ